MDNNLDNNFIKFGTDGFRGIIAKEFVFDKVELIAQGISEYLNNKKKLKNKSPRVVVGYDTRFLSNLFAQSACFIFAANKIETLLSKTFIPTPILSNAVVSKFADLGIMITASHNPYMYNGFKIKGPFGGSATMDIIDDIEVLVNNGIKNGSYEKLINSFKKNKSPYNDNLNECDFIADYEKQIFNLVNADILKKIDFKILIDPMYGAAQGICKSVFKNIGIKDDDIYEIHNILNPSFGGINPEPIGVNINEATDFIKKNLIEVGICLDGDADRIGVIDKDGDFVSSHHIFAIVLNDLIKNKKGRVVKTVTTSSIIDKIAKENNLELVVTPVGFKYIGEEILKGNVIMGGEESGGLWTYGNIPERDGMLMGLKLLEILVRQSQTLDEVLKDLYDKYGYFVYRRDDYEVEIEKRDKLKEALSKQVPQIIKNEGVKEIVTIDGFKYIFNDGDWLMIRPSGTEAVVRVYCESSNEKRLNHLLEIGRKVVGGCY